MADPDQQSEAVSRKPLPSLTYPTPRDRKRHQELLARPDRTKADRLRNLIDGDALLPSGQPLSAWKTYPVDKKFPVIPANDGVFGFSRGAVGQELFPRRPDHAFNTDDPLIKETPKGYEPMHDPHLKHYFKDHPELRERMVQEGLVEKDGSGVKAPMKDWNIYRSYLAKKKNDKISENFKTQSNLRKKESDQLRQILAENKKAERKEKYDKRKEMVDSVRNEKRARELHAQLQTSFPDVRNRLEEERALNVAISATKRELLHQQVKERIGKLKKAERKRARKIIIEWYCRQLYAEMMRKALRAHKKALREADLDSFVGTKREFQEHKLKYLQALEDRRQAERECRINKRISQCEKAALLKSKGRDLQREKEERDLALVRKFGMRWLNFVRNQKKQASTYHDSIWRVRQQLVELVSGLKQETGRVSFTSFIKGLVKLKPGRESQDIDMSDETKEVMNYILDLLIKAAYDTYKKHNHPCKNAYEKQANRRRIRGEPDIPAEDFEMPPRYVGRDKPNVPFPEIFLPCGSVCLGMREGYQEDPACEAEREAAALAEAELRRQLKEAGYKKGIRKSPQSSAGSSTVAEGLSKAAIRKAGNKLCKDGKPCDNSTSTPERMVRTAIEGAKKRHREGKIKWKGAPDQGSSTGSSTAAEKLSNAAIIRASHLVVNDKHPVMDAKPKKTKPHTRKGSANSSVVAEKLSKKAIKKAGANLCRDGTEGPCTLDSEESANSTSDGGGSSESGKEPQPQSEEESEASADSSVIADELSVAAIRTASKQACTVDGKPCKTEEDAEEDTTPEEVVEGSPEGAAREVEPPTSKSKADADEGSTTEKVGQPTSSSKDREGAEEDSTPEKVVERSPEGTAREVESSSGKSTEDEGEAPTPQDLFPKSPGESPKKVEPSSIGKDEDSSPEKVPPSSPPASSPEKTVTDSTPEKVVEQSSEAGPKEVEPPSRKSKEDVDKGATPEKVVDISPQESSPERPTKEAEPVEREKDVAKDSTPDRVEPTSSEEAPKVAKPPEIEKGADKDSTPEKVVPTIPEKTIKDDEQPSTSKTGDVDKDAKPSVVVPSSPPETSTQPGTQSDEDSADSSVVADDISSAAIKRAVRRICKEERAKPPAPAEDDDDSNVERVVRKSLDGAKKGLCRDCSSAAVGKVPPAPAEDDDDSNVERVVRKSLDGAKKGLCRDCSSAAVGKVPPAPSGAGAEDDDDSNVDRVVRKSIDGAKKGLCSGCSSEEEPDESAVAEKLVKKGIQDATRGMKPSGWDKDKKGPENTCKPPKSQSDADSEEEPDESAVAEKLVKKGIQDATSGMIPKQPKPQSDADSEDSADSSVVADELSRAAINRAVNGLCTGGGDIPSFGEPARQRGQEPGTSLGPKKSVKGKKSSTKSQRKPGMESDEDSSYAAEEIVWRSIAEVAKSEVVSKKKGPDQDKSRKGN